MKLEKYMHKHNITQKEMAKTLRTSQPYLNLLLNGKKVPSMEMAYRIYMATDRKVNLSDWLSSYITEQMSVEVPTAKQLHDSCGEAVQLNKA